MHISWEVTASDNEWRDEPPAERAVVILDGVLDYAGAIELRARLTCTIAWSTGDLVLDLRDVTAIDPTAVSVFVRAHRELADEGRRLWLRSASDDVRRVLDRTGASGTIPIE